MAGSDRASRMGVQEEGGLKGRPGFGRVCGRQLSKCHRPSTPGAAAVEARLPLLRGGVGAPHLQEGTGLLGLAGPSILA